jgi:hypothetical protein
MAKTIDFYGLENKPVVNAEAVTTLTPIGSFSNDVVSYENFIEDQILCDSIVYYRLHEISYEELIAICNYPTAEKFSKEAIAEAQDIIREVNGDSPGWATDTKFYFYVYS